MRVCIGIGKPAKNRTATTIIIHIKTSRQALLERSSNLEVHSYTKFEIAFKQYLSILQQQALSITAYHRTAIKKVIRLKGNGTLHTFGK